MAISGRTKDDMATNAAQVGSAIEATRLVPVVVIDDESVAEPLATALVAGGLPMAEVTFRTPAARDALRAMAKVPGMLVGAGTVLTVEQVDRAVDAGARYIVIPGFDAAVVRRAQGLGVPVFPGVATATEIQLALAEGLDVVKFFPAEPLGGLRMISALAGPFPHVRFMPTGGISLATLPNYLAHPSVLAVGGSWMVARRLIAARDFDAVTRLAAEAVAVVAARRSGAAHAPHPPTSPQASGADGTDDTDGTATGSSR